VDWRGGRVSGAIYHGGDELSSLITEAFGLFTIANVGQGGPPVSRCRGVRRGGRG
jgi:hypothetical protein